ncbi:MAG: polysaccharide biosynthesis/export family protein [Sphingobacteriia bacterium]
MFRSHSLLKALLLGFCVLCSVGCQRKVQLFRGDYEQYYREQKRVDRKAAVVTLRPYPVDMLSYRHRIRVGDELTLRIYNLPTVLETGIKLAEEPAGFKASVDVHGYVYFPLLPRLYAKGLLTEEVEELAVNELAKLYKDPLLSVRLSNLRAYVFGASGGRGVVQQVVTTGSGTFIQMEQEEESLVSILSKAGGISNTANIAKVKIIRNYQSDSLQIIWVDLRNPDVLNDPMLNIRSEDIVYMESRGLPLFLTELNPYLTFINVGLSLFLVYQAAIR